MRPWTSLFPKRWLTPFDFSKDVGIKNMITTRQIMEQTVKPLPRYGDFQLSSTILDFLKSEISTTDTFSG